MVGLQDAQGDRPGHATRTRMLLGDNMLLLLLVLLIRSQLPLAHNRSEGLSRDDIKKVVLGISVQGLITVRKSYGLLKGLIS